VGDLILTHGGIRAWNLSWRRNLFLWEEDLVGNLLTLLDGVARGSEEDRWIWSPEDEGDFSV